MNELITISKQVISGQPISAACARDLYRELDIKKDFSSWIKAQIKRARLVEGIDYIKLTQKGEVRIDYFLTIDSCKNISMMSGTDMGFEVRAYFIECEKIANEQAKLPTTYLEALQFLITAEVEKQKALDEVAKLNTLIDNEFGYSSIIRAATYAGVHETTFNWRTLKPIAIGLGLPPKRAPSPRFGYQNLYPIKAFQEAYPHIDFDDLKPELVDDKTRLAIT